MKLLILTEGSNTIGLGHIYRCLSIADEARRREIEVVFITSFDFHNIDLFQYDFKIQSWYEESDLKRILNTENPDVVLVDSYLAEKKIYSMLYHLVPSLLIIDDNNDFRYEGGGIINPSFFASELHYPINNHSFQFLLGSDYMILRPAFMKGNQRSCNDTIKNVLIMIGGTDPKGYSEILLQKVRNKLPEATIHLIIKNSDECNMDGVRYYSELNDKEMAEVMKKCDVAICGAGTTIYELIATQTPFLAIQVADNQANNIRMIKEYGLGIGIQEIEDFEPYFATMIEKTARESIIRKHKTYPLDGVKRIIDYGIVQGINIKEVEKEDSEAVYTLSTSNSVRKYSKNSKLFSFESHQRWFEDAISNQNILFLVLKEKITNRFLGQIRFQREGNQMIISLSFTDFLRGKGVSGRLLVRAMQKAKNKFSCNHFIAEINERNIPSKKLFESLGFEKIYQENDILIYKYIFEEKSQ